MSFYCFPVRVFVIVIILLPFPVSAVMIDLNDFFNDPTVTVSADGSSAVFREDPGFSEVALLNDPGFGDPEVIIAGQNLGLFFDYEFLEAPGEDDSVFQFILDGATGNSVGPAFEFFSEDSVVGTIVYDLTPLVGTQLGLSFSLQSGQADNGFGSTLTISNVRIEPLPVVSVSAPATFLYLLFGVAAMFMRIRRFGFGSSDRVLSLLQ